MKYKNWYISLVIISVLIGIVYLLQNKTNNISNITSKNILQKINYKVVENLATVNSKNYFLVCKKEGDCSPVVVYENKDAYVIFENSPTIYDIHYKISPNKKMVAYIDVINDKNQYGLFIFNIENGSVIKVKSDIELKDNETVACEIGSYGSDGYSCGSWVSDMEYKYGIYEKSNLADTKFKIVKENTYYLK
jgi:hypothetical protein